MEMKGTELFVKALQKEGVDIVFGYPGGFAIDLFDALYQQEGIEVVLPRHEQGLIHAADGYARSTGNVGVCLVTSGPGATNLVTGIATANYDSVPLVCFTGQVPTNLIGNDAFQEVDIVGITRSICKYCVTVRNREDLGRIIKEAFYIAKTGKPGPVLVDIPKDIQLAMGDDIYPKHVSIRGYKPSSNVHMGQIKKVANMLKEAEKPLMLVGGGVIRSDAKNELKVLLDKVKIPLITTIMGKGAVDTENPLYIGNIGMHGCYAANMAVSQCDVLLSIGTRFNDRITGKIQEFAPFAKIIHIDIDSAAISKNIKVDIPVVADAKAAITSLEKVMGSCEREQWIQMISQWKLEYPLKMRDTEGMTPEKIIRQINENFEAPIVATDVGQHQMWVTQFLKMNENMKLLTSGGLGTMGYGFPAAVGAQLGNKGKRVVCVSGDGGMQMNIQELATAVINDLPIVVCIFNNSYLGMVRQWQQLFYKERYSSTCLRRRKSCSGGCKGPGEQCPPYVPDFVKLAESYGAKGIRVEHENQIAAAFQEAAANESGPTIIEFIIETEEMVLPMVQGGNALSNMILEC